MLSTSIDLAAMAEALSRSADFRVLRRLVPRIPASPVAGQETETGVLLDTETTGLDHAKDEIIELGMVKFDYTADGRIVGVRGTLSAFNEPSGPISAQVTALTGITDEMVAGHRFDEAAITAFVEDAVIVIAHNSGFDRKFAERYWPVFEPGAAARVRSTGANTTGPSMTATLCWRCSLSNCRRRRTGARPPARYGTQEDGPDLGGAVAVRVEGFVETARLSLERRHGWPPQVVYVDVGESAVDDELAFLKSEIYLRDVEPRLQTLTAFTRFSCRV